jgi:hypothetical protein
MVQTRHQVILQMVHIKVLVLEAWGPKYLLMDSNFAFKIGSNAIDKFGFSKWVEYFS